MRMNLFRNMKWKGIVTVIFHKIIFEVKFNEQTYFKGTDSPQYGHLRNKSNSN